MLLEFSQYLENYLWPNYSYDATDAHVLSIVVMVNEKFRERVPAWEVCHFLPLFTFISTTTKGIVLASCLVNFMGILPHP